MNKYNAWIVGIPIVLCMGLMFLFGYWTAKAKYTKLTPAVQIDTVYSTRTVHDTLKIVRHTTKHDTVRIGTLSVETSSVRETLGTYGILDVKYWPRPIDRFDVAFRPFPQRDTFITRTIRVPYYIEHTSWYNNPTLNRTVSFAVGLAAGIYITKKFGG